MFLTTVMSLGLRVLRLLIADWRAGIASARSFSQSSLEMFDVVFVVAMVVKIASFFVKGDEGNEVLPKVELHDILKHPRHFERLIPPEKLKEFKFVNL